MLVYFVPKENPNFMNPIDIILGVFLLWGMIRGFRNGLIIELASLAALALGLYGALRFSYHTSAWMVDHFSLEGRTLHIISFFVTFLVIVAGVHLLARLLDKLVKAVALGFFNRLLGILLGLVKVAFVLSILLVPVDALNRNSHFIPEQTLRSSLFYGPVSRFAPTLFSAFHFDLKSPLRNPATKKEHRPETV